MIALSIAQTSAAAGSTDEGGAGWLLDPERIDPGYGQTMAGGEIQTSFPPPPPPQSSQPWDFGWLRDFFEWTAPALKPLLWIGAAALLLVILYHFVPAFADWVDNLRFGRKRGSDEEEAEATGHTEADAARARLADADALAADGRFAEAVHLLLHRSVGDIAGRRPGLVRPAMTSRALAATHLLPAAARHAFSRIARAVEISLFGGRPIDARTWQECRSAYAELTVPQNWSRA